MDRPSEMIQQLPQHYVRGPKRDEVFKLIEEKNRMEKDLCEQHAILQLHHSDMFESLVDDQGFPRADIDVYQVRHARHNIICLQNDLRNIFNRIEVGLAEAIAEESMGEQLARRTAMMQVNESNGKHADNVPLKPFLLVTMVDNGSPADIAGLCTNDLIIQFGTVKGSNFTCMEDIYNIVSHSIGQPISLQVVRGTLVIGVTLVPKPWSNRGLLGCHIQKMEVQF